MSDFAQISSSLVGGSGCISPGSHEAAAEQSAARIMPKVNADLKSDGWQMFSDTEEDCGTNEEDEDGSWISLTVKSVESIKKQEKASPYSFNRKSLNEKIGELCGSLDDAMESEPELEKLTLNATSVKRSRGSRPFILVLLDPFVRARVPLAILLVIGIILAASLYQAVSFSPLERSVQKTAPLATAPAVAHVVRLPHVQHHSALHYQHAVLPANTMEPEVTVTVPVSAEYGHRHAYQTYR
jgi:hypothetical protein